MPTERGIRGLEVVPFFELNGVLLVHKPGVLEQLVPVILDAVFLLDEGNGVLEHLRGIGVRARLVVDHRERYGEVRQRHAAALDHGGTLGGVARHVRREERLADDGERIVDSDAGLRGAARAHVRSQTEGLGHVDIVRLDVLVHVADDELRAASAAGTGSAP